MKTKTQKQIKQGLTLIVHHRAPLRNWNFVKPQTLQISNLTVSKRFWGSFINRAQKLSKNSKPLWKLCSGRGSVIHPSSKNKGLRDIGHEHGTRYKEIYFYERTVVMVSYLVYYDMNIWKAYLSKIQTKRQTDWHTTKLVAEPQITCSTLTKIVIILIAESIRFILSLSDFTVKVKGRTVQWLAER